MVRVHFEGRSYDIVEHELDISSEMTDREIKQQLAYFFAVRADRLRDYTVDRLPSGHLRIQPDLVSAESCADTVTLVTL